MDEKFNTAIAIRSFDLHGKAYAKLSIHTNIVFINSSGQRLSEMDLCKAIKNADGVIAGTELYPENVLQSAPHLKVISRVGVGLDNIDLDYTKKAGIRILNTPLAPVDAVAEHTIALMLAVMKNIPQYYAKVHRGDYSISMGSLLAGKTTGIIGLGRIGQRVAALLESFGSEVTFYDPWVKNPVPERWIRKDTPEELLHDADIITLHSSSQEGGSPLMDGRAFASCKHGVVLINTARGSLIDEAALARSLDSGIVSGAGLDVVSVEPYNGPLLNYPQVVITPHVASNTFESRQHMEIEAVENILNAFGV